MWSNLSPTTLLGSELNALAPGARVVAIVNNNTNTLAEFQLTVTFAAAPTGSAVISLFLLPSLDGGTTYADGSATIDPAANLQAAILFPKLVTTQQVLSIANIIIPPGNFKVLIRNDTNQAFAASGNTLKIGAYDSIPPAIDWTRPGTIGSNTPSSIACNLFTFLSGGITKLTIDTTGTINFNGGQGLTFYLNGDPSKSITLTPADVFHGELGVSVPKLQVSQGRFDFVADGSGKAEMRVTGSNTNFNVYNTDGNFFYFRCFNDHFYVPTTIYTDGNLIAGNSNPKNTRLFVDGHSYVNGIQILKPYTVSTLPSATTFDGGLAYVTDGTTKLAFATGGTWHYISMS